MARKAIENGCGSRSKAFIADVEQVADRLEIVVQRLRHQIDFRRPVRRLCSAAWMMLSTVTALALPVIDLHQLFGSALGFGVDETEVPARVFW